MKVPPPYRVGSPYNADGAAWGFWDCPGTHRLAWCRQHLLNNGTMQSHGGWVLPEMEHANVVLCHHSPRWISLTFGQDPLYLGWWLLSICGTAFYKPHQPITPIPRHPSHSSFTSGQYLLPSKLSHLSATWSWLIHNTLIYHICTSKDLSPSCKSYILEIRCGMWWKGKTMEILSGDKVPLGGQ